MPTDPSTRASDLAAAALTRALRAITALRALAATIPDDALLNIITQPTDIASLRALVAAADAARPPAEPLLAVALDRGRDATDRLLKEAGGALTTSEAALLLGLYPQTVTSWGRSHLLLVLPGEDGPHSDRYPRCQFTEARPSLPTFTVLPGLSKVLQAMASHGPVVTLSFLLSPSARLPDDARPIDLLRAGRVAEVLDAASRYGEHGG
jgi:hypothetical protein